jgi:hypothetical protein
MPPPPAARSVAGMPNTALRITAVTATTAAAAAGALLLTGAERTPAAALIDAPRTLTFTEPFSANDRHYTYVDVGRRGMSRGDVIVHVDSPGIDATSGRRTASSDGIQTILSVKRPGAIAISDTIRLAGGRLQIAGTVRNGERTQALAVIGGTGRYANARGDVTITEDTAHRRNLITVRILP